MQNNPGGKMLCLSSGKIVDLSTDRAKYHALRNQGPGPDAHHQFIATETQKAIRSVAGQNIITTFLDTRWRIFALRLTGLNQMLLSCFIG